MASLSGWHHVSLSKAVARALNMPLRVISPLFGPRHIFPQNRQVGCRDEPATVAVRFTLELTRSGNWYSRPRLSIVVMTIYFVDQHIDFIDQEKYAVSGGIDVSASCPA
jgi:hypothetical protein